VRLRLFWQLALTYLALLLAVLLAVDVYTASVLRRGYLRAGFEQLDAIGRLALARPPEIPAPDQSFETLRAWVTAMSASGARVTVIAADGRVLADSAHDPDTMENHAGRPEIHDAFGAGQGRAVRHSATLNRDLVYLAIRYQSPADSLSPTPPPVILRFALPLQQIDEVLAGYRRSLWAATLVILLVAGGAALLISRSFTRRIRHIQEFSRRVANGDFHPLHVPRSGDELAELSRSLNETAGRLDQTIRSLTAERNRSAAILSSMVEGVAVMDAAGRMVFANQAFTQLLGSGASAPEGRPLVEVTRQTELLDVARRALAGREIASSEVTVGTVRQKTFAVTAAPVLTLGSQAAAAGAVLVLHDISEQRRLERVRRDFVANVSHELRTPLTAIQGFAETLLAGAIDDRENRVRFLEIIRDHSKRLARLTDDLLKLSRIEADQMQLDLRPVGVAELIAGCLETTRMRAEQKQLSIESECPDGLPAVKGDRGRLGEVLQNLLDNAVQYTPPNGRIRVSARAHEGGVVITVSDNGIGIPQSDQSRIFERFYRVDAARSRELGGTGLGLAIARHIVEAHGGRIWVESTIGKGSEFHFSIPAAA
jgi:two-component system, OmpR family, phosphate regulon sensor histidine kinase PhoR